MVHATDSFTVGCDIGFPTLPLSQSIRQLTVHSWVWVRPEERAVLVTCLKDILLLKMAEGKLSRRRDIHADKRQRAGSKRRLSILLIIQT